VNIAAHEKIRVMCEARLRKLVLYVAQTLMPAPRTTLKPRVTRKTVKRAAPRKVSGRATVPRPKNAAERQARVHEILKRLDVMYPNATCALAHHTPWELLVSTILSAQCTDKRVNEVTPGLFQKYPAIQDFAALRPEVLAQDIRSTGFFNNKAKSIVGAARKILNDYRGEIPRTLEEMLTIPGAARKTANVVLGTAYGLASGIVVDTHVQRLSRRLDFTKQNDPVKIERDLQKIIPKEKWIVFSHQLIHHGRALCIARKPRCADCRLNDICYARDKTI